MDELYAPLPDVRAYLDRIGFEREPELNIETLNELVLRHHKTVPFENYLISEEKKPVELGVEALFDKIVVRRRGGYCFEVNGLFYSLLIAIGFDAYPVIARITRDLNAKRPPLHRVTVVKLDGKCLYLDVGAGGAQPAGALSIEEDTKQTLHGETYYFYKYDEYYWQLMRYNSEGEIVPMTRFMNVPFEQTDFVSPNWYTSTHPDSVFINSRSANLRRDDGHCSIREGQFRFKSATEDFVIDITSKEQEFRILREYFGIVI